MSVVSSSTPGRGGRVAAHRAPVDDDRPGSQRAFGPSWATGTDVMLEGSYRGGDRDMRRRRR